MKPKHTPGPWVFQDDAEAAYNGYIVSHFGNFSTPTPIALMHVFGVESNTSLIAAAPDLLEALEELAFRAERHGMNADEARAALAKARGEG